MQICISSFKGGSCKSSLAVNLALTLPGNHGIITNDVYSPLEAVLPESRFLKLFYDQPFPDLPEDANIIYDLGGYIDPRTTHVLRTSDVVIVPCLSEYIDLQMTIDCLAEIEKFNSNILVVITKTKGNDFSFARAVIEKFYKYPVLEIKYSRAFPAIFKEKISVQDMVNQGGLKAYNYRLVNEQFNVLVTAIEEKAVMEWT